MIRLAGAIRRSLWIFLAIVLTTVLATSYAHGQSSGTYVDECSSGTVDPSYDIEQTVCLYGDEAGGVDAYAQTDDDEYEDWGGGDFFVPEVGAEAQVYDGGTLVSDTGTIYASAGYSAYASPGYFTPVVNDWYTLDGYYAECYDPSGDGYSCTWYTGYTGLSVAVQVTPSTTLSVSSSGAASTPGASVTFTATISSGPTGTITFYDSGASIGTGTISGTTATLTTSALTVGDHVITASWPGNMSYGAATSSPITQVVYQTGPIQLPGGTDINTVAGNGYASFYGDGSSAMIAELYYPIGVALDSAGNIYIADHDNHRIRMVNASTGNISTVAGNGTAGFSGDGGAATSAELNYPGGVAVDASGDLYISDLDNNRIRKVVLSTGVITTVAGNGTAGYSGDGGAATSAELYQPYNVAVDTYGNIYIDDWANCRIRKVTRATSVISTVAGSSSCGYSGDGGAATSAELNEPAGVALDSSGNMYIADGGNNRIRKVTAGVISTVVGTGTAGFSGDSGAATSAKLNNPYAVAVDSSGDLYISDLGNYRVREVNESSHNIYTIAGDGTGGYFGDGGAATSAEIGGPYGLAVDASDNVYVADLSNQRIRVVGTDRTNSSISVATSTTPAATGTLVTFTAVTSAGGSVAPSGSASFYDGTTAIGAGSIISTSATNLVPYSQAFGNSVWSGYCGPTSNMTVNTADLTAPDGTNTATKFVIPTSTPCDGSQPGWGVLATIPGGLETGQTYTVSVWLRGASGGEAVGFGMNDCAFGGITLTSSWKRYTATYSSISSSVSSCSDGTRGFQVSGGSSPGGTYYVWGAQVEQASSAGPYIVTGASSATGYGGIATFSTNLLSAGTHTITSAWPGDGNYRPATSNQISQSIVAPVIPTISWTTPSAISYGTALSGTQLDASASVAGTYVYTPEAGAVLAPGSQELSVTFYPTDSGDYTTVTGSVTLTVNTSSDTPSPIYSYCVTTSLGSDCPSSPSGYAANGNILAYTDSVNGSWGSIGYDSENRLSAATQTIGGTTGYLCWNYDDFGNRTMQEGSTSAFTNSAGASCSTSGTPTTNSAAYNAYNQITSTNAPGVTTTPDYDASGNTTYDGNIQYLYDGEGRVCATKNLTTSAMTQYIYDAEGTRVAKGTISSWSCDTSSNGFSVTNSYVLGPGNEQLTEMALSDGSLQWEHTNVYGAGMMLATYDNLGIHFQLADWLGTRRVQTDYAGNTEETCTSQAFGDALSCPTTDLSTADDATEHHFTGKERDSESGNDYFGARYYASSMGRMMSPDDFTKDTHVADPQSWNLYAYARNNPLRYVDPTGQNATESTTCSTSNNQTTCNVSITASIAIYAQAGSGLSQDQLNAAAGTMQSSINNAWSGSFVQDGVTYNVSTNVSVSVVGSESAGISSGAQNVIGMTNGPPEPGAGAFINPKSALGALTGAADTGQMDINNVDNYAKHEFTHMLGTDDKGGAVLSNTDPSMRPGRVTTQDLKWGVQEATQGVNNHYSKGFFNSSPSPNYSGQTNVGAAWHWWK